MVLRSSSSLHSIIALLGGLVCGAAFSEMMALTPPVTQESAANIALPTAAGSTSPLLKAATDMGIVDAATPLTRMLLLLKPSKAQSIALQHYLDELQDRRSPRYHRWLTPQQFGTAYGPSVENRRSVIEWLGRHDMTVDAIASGGQWIEFSGNVAQVETAFHTSIRSYSLNGTRHLANATDLHVPASLASLVLGVLSLNDFESIGARVHGISRSSPSMFAENYNLNALYQSGIEGAGQTIAVIERSNLRIPDIEAFRKKFSLPLNNPSVLLNGADPGRTSDELEALQDAAWAGAIAPEATVKVVVSASTTVTDGIDLSIAYAVDRVVAPVLEISYIACENDLDIQHQQFYNEQWMQAAAEGITIVVAAGNQGAACGESGIASPIATGFGVNAVASTPYDVAVGGTSVDSSGESAWNDAMGAGGGGQSALYKKPPWQPDGGVLQESSEGSLTHPRSLPDIALDAGGSTAASAAAFAGIMALVDQFTNSRQGNAAPSVYALASKHLALRDVTAGNTQLSCEPDSPNCEMTGMLGFDANRGYDLATGLGSVDATAFVRNFAQGSTTGSAPATVTLVVSAELPPYGSVLIATATVQTATTTANSQPLGTVLFLVDSTAAGTSALSVGGSSSTASLQLTTPTVGTHTVSASYLGNDVYAPATSAPLTINVEKGASATTLMADPSPLLSGISENLTAHIVNAASTPAALNFTGNIVFYDGTQPLGNQVNVTSDQAVLANIILDPTSTHTITAKYYGDGNWLGSVSAPLISRVATSPTSTTLSASNTSAVAGTMLSFTATVNGSDRAMPSTAPTGPIGFYDGTAYIGAVTLAAGSGRTSAIFSTSTLAGGEHSMSAEYLGDANFSASHSNVVVIQVASYTVVPNTHNLTLTAGQSGSVLFTVTGNIKGAISFSCQAPVGTDTGCSFDRDPVAGSGQTTMTITSESGSQGVGQETMPIRIGGLFALILLTSVPYRYKLNKRSLFTAFILLVSSMVVGCATSNHVNYGSGTPHGTQVFTVITSTTVNDQTIRQVLYIDVNII